MATRQQDSARRKDTIRCPYCGEDYSVTYRRCPFCDGKPQRGGSQDPDDTVVGPGGSRTTSGGKRLVTNKRGGGYGGGMEPVQIIGLALSIILIIAALYIVYSVVSPMLGFGKKPVPSISGSGGNSTSQGQTGVSSQGGSTQPNQGSTSTADPAGPSVGSGGDNPSSGTTTPPPSTSKVTAIIISNNGPQEDITISAGGSHQLTATLVGGDGTETVTWTSSNTKAIMVDSTGMVTNVNTGTTRLTSTITVSCGDVSKTTIVRADPPGTGTAGDAGSGNATVNAVSGLRIRSGPGTTYDVLATLSNGAPVTIVEDTGSGWYKISFVNSSGEPTIGYVSKDFITVNS